MARASSQQVFFDEDEADSPCIYVDEGEAAADSDELIFSDDEVFVREDLQLLCNIADEETA